MTKPETRLAKVRRFLAAQRDRAAADGRSDDAAAFAGVDSLLVELVDEATGYADPDFWRGKIGKLGLYTEAQQDRGAKMRQFLRSIGVDTPEPGEQPAKTGEA